MVATVLNRYSTNAATAPAKWANVSDVAESKLHQLAPYIGKLKPAIARDLLQEFTSPNDLVLDCFSGSGTIPLEAVLLKRRVIAYDANPYAITLTRAKLESPPDLTHAIAALKDRLEGSRYRKPYWRWQIPDWVQKFFHPTTLQSALAFADECLDRDDQFLLACLLSILHHQRPGFLSYPSSHLVPYLRDKKFPRDQFPDMYGERAIEPRLLAKLERIYRFCPVIDRASVIRVGHADVSTLALDRKVDAIVTSPPYMNALDYVRDNRLRMWFLDRKTSDYSPEPTEKALQSDLITNAFSKNALSKLRDGGVCILIVGETVRRKRQTSHPADRILSQISVDHPHIRLDKIIQDEIPDIRRSRRSAAGTKRELILVLRKP